MYRFNLTALNLTHLLCTCLGSVSIKRCKSAGMKFSCGFELSSSYQAAQLESVTHVCFWVNILCNVMGYTWMLWMMAGCGTSHHPSPDLTRSLRDVDTELPYAPLLAGVSSADGRSPLACDGPLLYTEPYSPCLYTHTHTWCQHDGKHKTKTRHTRQDTVIWGIQPN